MDNEQQAQQRRLETVLEHMRHENNYDFADCIGTFHHARYEIVPTGEVYDGEMGVAGFLTENRDAFANFHFEPHRTAPGDDFVLVEGTFTGTHTGTWRGLPATGHAITVRMAVVFEFEGEGMVCERVYFDLGTVLQQLGVAHDPMSSTGRLRTFVNHPFAIARAALGGLLRRPRQRVS